MDTIQGDSALNGTNGTPQTTAYFRGILKNSGNAGGYEENSNPTGTAIQEDLSLLGGLLFVLVANR
ncbi:hypothetical protein M2112_001106 [Aurantimicrobium minutum]|nr:hypothetical protein [Aurantimicrobium minutum]